MVIWKYRSLRIVLLICRKIFVKNMIYEWAEATKIDSTKSSKSDLLKKNTSSSERTHTTSITSIKLPPVGISPFNNYIRYIPEKRSTLHLNARDAAGYIQHLAFVCRCLALDIFPNRGCSPCSCKQVVDSIGITGRWVRRNRQKPP